MAGKTSFLGMSVRVSREEIGLESVGLSKDQPTLKWTDIMSSVKSPNRTKIQRKISLAGSQSWDRHLYLHLNILCS